MNLTKNLYVIMILEWWDVTNLTWFCNIWHDLTTNKNHTDMEFFVKLIINTLNWFQIIMQVQFLDWKDSCLLLLRYSNNNVPALFVQKGLYSAYSDRKSEEWYFSLPWYNYKDIEMGWQFVNHQKYALYNIYHIAD